MKSGLNKYSPKLSRGNLNSDKCWKITKISGTNGCFSATKSRTADGSKVEDKRVKTSRDLTVTELILDQANLCILVGTSLATLAIASIWKRR